MKAFDILLTPKSYQGAVKKVSGEILSKYEVTVQCGKRGDRL